MATINDLINAACEIRDADQDRENTAMRVGSLLVDIIDYIGGFVSISTLQNILADYAALDSRGQVEWRQARVISLYSMGTEYDNVDGGDWTPESSPVGSVVYEKSGSSHRLRFKKTSDTIEDYPCILNAIYINLHSLRLYTFSETEGMVELSTNAAGGGGTTVTITKGGGYVDIDIIDNTPRITLSTQSIAMSGNDKTATFKVSGVNLKGPISINGNNAYFSKSPRSISPVGGVVNDATVTVTFGGTNDDTDDLIVSSPGATAQTIHVAYTAVAGPNIIVSPATLSFKAATNQTQTKQVAVQGSLLTDDVEVTAGGAFQVSLQSGSGFANSVTIPKARALAGITVYVRYTAGSSATTGTLTLTSDGAADKTVDLTGAVVSLTVSESSLSFSTTVGTPAAQTFTVRGANLSDDISISVSGTGFSVSPATIDKDDAGTAQTVTVTYNPSAAGTNTGTVTIQSSGLSETIDLSGSAEAVPEFSSSNSYQQKIGGIYYKVIMNGDNPTTNLQVCNSSYSGNAAANSYSGDVVIPSTVSALLDGNQTLFSVTEIRANAFSSCSSLNSVIVPNSVTSLGNYCFSGNNAMKKIVLGSGCTDLFHNEFYNNTSQWEEIDFGENITSVASNSFKLKDTAIVTLRYAGYNGTTPKRVNFNSAPFSNTNGTRPCAASLYVPSTHVQSYKDSNYWGNPAGGANQQFQQGNIFAITE